LSHTYTRNYIHVVFSTKERKASIAREFESTLWAYISGICRNHGVIPVAVGGRHDHVHLLFHLPPTIALSKAVLAIKSNSSRWIKDHVKTFEWQQGYSAFSVSASNLEPVIKYIQNQDSYHKKLTFEHEYLALLKRHGVEFDPKYVLG
jgi:putative transposase